MCCPAHKWRKRHEYTARLNSLDHLGWALPMDASSVLLALDEQKKWRGGPKRNRGRPRTPDRRRDNLRKELEGGRENNPAYTPPLAGMAGQAPTRAGLPPRAPGRGPFTRRA